MLIPNNEGKVCDAVVRLLEKWTDKTRSDVRHPEREPIGPSVDLRLKLGAQEYAIEHTRIEPFQGQIKTGTTFKKINSCIKQRVLGTLPGPAYYELHVPINICLPKKRSKQTLDNLAEWIQTNAQILHERNLIRSRPILNPRKADDRIQGTPVGFNCAIELLRWPNALVLGRKPGFLAAKLLSPDDLESQRSERLRQAFEDKCPKLDLCKQDGARTVLVLENIDIALTSFGHIGEHLPMLLAKRTDSPDEIYLVETYTNPWWVYPMKRDDDHWPSVGMLQWDQTMCEADKLHTAGVSEEHHDTFGLDQMDSALPGWVPAIFDKGELEDLTLERDGQI